MQSNIIHKFNSHKVKFQLTFGAKFCRTMRGFTIRHHASVLTGLLLVMIICLSLRSSHTNWKNGLNVQERKDPNRVVLAVVSCGDRYEEALTLIKSAVLFSQDISLHVIVVADDEKFTIVADKVHKLAQEAVNAHLSFTYEMQMAWFPPENEDTWKKLYAPCSAQRIFFPSLLAHVDSVIYMDSDTFFVSKVKDLWEHFARMNSTQWLAAANEDEPKGDGWYNTKAKIPYYGSRGLNTGVMLLNLTRMRHLGIESMAMRVHREYGPDLRWGDQDIFNVILHRHPEYAFQLPCEFNFRASHCHCRYNGNCSCGSASTFGVRIIHGNLKSFLSNEYPLFKGLFAAMKEHLLSDKPWDLYQRFRLLHEKYQNESNKCTDSHNEFWRNLRVYRSTATRRN